MRLYSSRAAAMLFSALAGTSLTLIDATASAAPNGRQRTLASHRGPRADPPGVIAETRILPNAAQGLARRYGGTPIDALTYHYDTARTGWNQSETDLTPASVASAKFGLLKTLTVDGTVFAEPLLVSGFVMPDSSTHDVLIVVTAHDSVYAYDAQTYAVLWQVSVGTSQNTKDIGCNDVVPEYGISSTPVIVRGGANAATLYLVGATEPSKFSFHTQIHALDLGTGKDLTPPQEIAPTATLSDGSTLAFDPQNQWNRAGLAYANGSIYVGVGSHCDNAANSISGWLLRYTNKLKLKNSFHTIENPAGTELSSIWMTGFAPSVDSQGHVFVVTGNGNYNLDTGGNDYGESVLGLLPSLGRVKNSFTPDNFANLNDNDTDFGSGGVMLIPPVNGQAAPPLAVAMGKDAVLYLLDSTKLGGKRKNDSGALQSQRLANSGSGIWGGPAYYMTATGGTVFAQTDSDVLRAFSVNTGSTPALTQTVHGTTQAGYGGSLPIVSSNGTAAGTGIVWLARRAHTVQLEAYDAALLGAPVYAATAGTWANPDNNAFVTPLEANGRVYVGATGTVSVFGLTP